MTSRLPVRGRADLPDTVAPTTRVYVKPLARPWATGTSSSERVEVFLRKADVVESAVATHRDAAAWSASLDRPQARRVQDQLAAATVPNPDVAGLGGAETHVMGIINVTPDSFSDGGQAYDAGAAERQGRDMLAAGATVLDIGGESTRPGSDPVDEAEELQRVIPVIERLADCGAPLSIDTCKASVMAAALDAGASVVNDVSALTHDPDAMALVAERGVPVVLMHALSDSKTMQNDPTYDHVSLDIFDYLETRIAACVAAGIPRHNIIVDSGLGFGKTLHHNLILLRDLALFRSLGCPTLLGASRKRFIGTLADEPEPCRRVSGSVAVTLAGVHGGTHILRVHDVAETVQALRVWQAIETGEG